MRKWRGRYACVDNTLFLSYYNLTNVLLPRMTHANRQSFQRETNNHYPRTAPVAA